MATTTSRSERYFAAIARRGLLAVGLGALSAIASCREQAPEPRAQRVHPAPSAPANLVFEGTLHEPEAFHRVLVQGTLPAARAFASRWEPPVSAWMDLPRAVGERLDPKGPLLFAGFGSDERVSLVYAARVLSGEEVVALLTQGSAAPRRAERRPDGVVLLKPAPGATAETALAVVDGFVLTSSSIDALERGAAYVARTVSQRGGAERGVRLGVPKRALEGPLRELLAERWSGWRAELERSAAELTRERGRAADFAEPAAVLDLADGLVRDLLDVIASSRTLALAVLPFDDRLEVTLELEPDETGVALALADALRLARLDALVALPADSALAVSWLPVPRSDDAESGEVIRAVFGPRLAAREAERVTAWLQKTRRDAPTARTFALLADRTLVYREERAPGAPGTDLADTVALLELPAFGEPFAQLFGKPRALPARAKGSAAVRLEPRASGEATKPSELVWSAGPLEATLAVGPSARTAVESRADAGSARLGLSPALRARHEPAAFALHAELSRLGVGSASAPVLLSLTRRARTISLRLELSRGASQVLLERILRR